jgi:hypothetical protein
LNDKTGDLESGTISGIPSSRRRLRRADLTDDAD